jgi:hypothetical protein
MYEYLKTIPQPEKQQKRKQQTKHYPISNVYMRKQTKSHAHKKQTAKET